MMPAVKQRPERVPVLGGMVPPPEMLVPARPDRLIAEDGRPTPEFRRQLRHIPSWRNGASVLSLYAQTGAVMWATVNFGPWSWPIGFVLMGRTHAQFVSLMHEAAHRLLFADRRLNDFVGKWLLGYPSFTPTEAYRRVHMAHHREEFGPNEPDIPLYADYPIAGDSFRRKLLRDATGRTGWRLMRDQLDGLRSTGRRRRQSFELLGVQAVLLGAAALCGYPLVYPLLWLAPFLTVWRVINRLRAIAEHGGMDASSDRRATTHTVHQSAAARFLMVPYNIGWHLAHHVDSGIPFRNLPRYHRALRAAGYITPALEHPSYPSLWRALRTAG
ncbi:fatty acid desaturase family protein [soil metagenome]